jgi:hypothetical protein
LTAKSILVGVRRSKSGNVKVKAKGALKRPTFPQILTRIPCGCFAVTADAEKFMALFGGEKFDPARRGRGRNWMRWKK